MIRERVLRISSGLEPGPSGAKAGRFDWLCAVRLKPHPSQKILLKHALSVLTLILLLVSCGHPKQTPVDVPPPPAPSATNSTEPQPGEKTTANARAGTAKSAEDADLVEPTISANARPLAVETGLASWYGPPYHNRVGSNGEVYNMHAMTAAHRTYPLGSIVRVTNVKTGQVAVVRITDRGPFIPGRILDLSLAAARKIDVYQPGVAQVKVELMQTPAALESGGKWAVQIGGFPDEGAATKLSDHLKRRYHTAKVLCFASPAGDWWIRVRVLDDNHERAKQLAAETQTPEGAVFLVRLD
jgi:rare lipoprotein A